SLVFRRTLYVCQNLNAGDVLNRENLRAIRPGYGLPPKFFDQLIGKRVKREVKRGTPMTWDLLCVGNRRREQNCETANDRNRRQRYCQCQFRSISMPPDRFFDYRRQRRRIRARGHGGHLAGCRCIRERNGEFAPQRIGGPFTGGSSSRHPNSWHLPRDATPG